MQFRVPLSLVLAGTVSACVEAREETADLMDMNEAAWLDEDRFEVDVPITVEIQGDRRAENIEFTLEATVSATSAAVAQREADRVAVTLNRTEETITFGLTVPSSTVADIVGRLVFTIPAELEVVAVSRQSGVQVSGIEAPITVASASDTLIEDAQFDTNLNIAGGTAVVDTRASAGTQTLIETQGALVQVNLPNPVSAELFVRTTGQITLAHPELPPPLPNSQDGYAAILRGGLSRVTVNAGRGSVVISERN